MRHKLAIICGFVLVGLPAAAHPQSSPDKSTSKAQIVSIAEILKIDAKKKSLQVKDIVEAQDTQPRQGTGRRTGGGGGRGGSGGGGRRGGGGGGGNTGGIRLPGGVGFPGGGTGGGNGTNQAKEYKVFVTKDTVMKIAEQHIEFSDLHVGDRITISGTPKGHDVEAVTISRDLH